MGLVKLHSRAIQLCFKAFFATNLSVDFKNEKKNDVCLVLVVNVLHVLLLGKLRLHDEFLFLNEGVTRFHCLLFTSLSSSSNKLLTESLVETKLLSL